MKASLGSINKIIWNKKVVTASVIILPFNKFAGLSGLVLYKMLIHAQVITLVQSYAQHNFLIAQDTAL